MDFSGHAGRVIENPQEALSAATEEAQAWRVRPSHTYASAVLAPNGLSWREGGKGLGDPVNAKGSLTSMSSIAEEDKPPSQPFPLLVLLSVLARQNSWVYQKIIFIITGIKQSRSTGLSVCTECGWGMRPPGLPLLLS